MIAFVQTTEPDYKFPVGYHVSLKRRTDVAMDARVFKWQAAQVISSMSNSRMLTETNEAELKLKRCHDMGALLTGAQSETKRLRLVRSDAGGVL